MICQICGKDCEGTQGLTSHAFKTHGLTSKEYYDRFIRKPGEGICRTCGKPTKFIKFGRGYRKHCNYYCSSNDPEANRKRVETFDSTKDRSSILIEAFKRYKERTGYAHPSQDPTIKERKFKTKMTHYLNCEIKLGYVKSKAETEIYNFICTFYTGEIKQNCHGIIANKELDIYFPNLHKAIEYNGTYWHADPRFYNDINKIIRKNVTVNDVWNRDREKRVLCENNNIELLVIWEYDYKKNKNIILEKIRNFIKS